MALTIEKYATAKNLPVRFLRKLCLEDIEWQGTPALRVPYFDADGEEACARVRLSMNKDGRFRWETGSKPCLYGLWRLKRMESEYICLVEGESDCHTLWQNRLPALGIPGAANWKEDWAPVLKSFERIYVIIEPDAGGEAVRKWLRKSSIRDRAHLVMMAEAKDPCELYLADPEGFSEAWKAAMKAAVPWSDEEEDDVPPGLSQAGRLLSLADQAELFHTPDGEPFASVPVNEHKENWPIRSRSFRQWLLRGYYLETKSAPQNKAVQEVMGVLEGKANFEGAECPVFVRVADQDGKIYLDLGDKEWNAVEIDAKGWRVSSEVPVRFRRARGMAPLPRPAGGDETEALRPFVNVATDNDWILLQSWLVAAFRPRGPYPILVLHGEQGSAKSTTSRVLRSLLDPSTAPLRSEPREERDLVIAASNGWVINLDNLSRIPGWLSDGLCRLSTGGGFATRELFTDREEALFDAQRAIIINGIEELAVRGDLLDRALILYLPPIPEQEREPESEFWRDFESRRPAILGAFLDAVSDALRRLPTIKLPNTPRLADFALWATAAESLGWEDGSFLTAYLQNQSAANDLALDASPVSDAIRRLVSDDGFEGTATELLKALSEHADESTRRQKGWPQNGRGLSNTLRRLASNLRKCGIEVLFRRSKDRSRRRLISVRQVASRSSVASG